MPWPDDLERWLNLVLEFLKVLAWPGTALILACTFRRPIVEALRRLRKFSGMGFDARFAGELADVAIDAEGLPELRDRPTESSPPHKSPSPSKGKPAEDQHRALDDPQTAMRDPEVAAVIEQTFRTAPPSRWAAGVRHGYESSDRAAYGEMLIAWQRVERVAAVVGGLIGMSDTAARNMGTLSGRLVPHGFMSEETASIAIRLQRIRNQLVHDAERVEFTPDLLTNFLDAASNLEDALEIIAAKLRHPSRNGSQASFEARHDAEE